MVILNFDTLEHIIHFCDIQSIYNFLTSSKKIYEIYLSNKNCIDRIISKKILKYFKIKFSEKSIYHHILYNKNSFIVHKQICYLYKKNSYLNNNNSNDNRRIADHIKTLINITNEPTLFNDFENNNLNNNYNHICKLSNIISDNNQLFNFLLEQCSFKFWIKEKDSTNINILSSNDVEYILTNGTIYMANSILNKFYISPGIISQCILSLIEQHNLFDEITVSTKINKYLNYFIVKNFQKLSLKTQFVNPYYIFDTETDMYFHEIILTLIRYNKINILESILLLKRKYRLRFNYDILFNYAIETDNLKILKILYKENRLDCFNSDEFNYDNNFNINISNHTITLFFEKGTLKSFSFILNHNLFNNINNKINYICNGLTQYFYKINNTYIFDNKNSSILKRMSVLKTMQRFNQIAPLLTANNRLFINKHLNLLQIRAGINTPILLYID